MRLDCNFLGVKTETRGFPGLLSSQPRLTIKPQAGEEAMFQKPKVDGSWRMAFKIDILSLHTDIHACGQTYIHPPPHESPTSHKGHGILLNLEKAGLCSPLRFCFNLLLSCFFLRTRMGNSCTGSGRKGGWFHSGGHTPHWATADARYPPYSLEMAATLGQHN